jgi:hypothetical protein
MLARSWLIAPCLLLVACTVESPAPGAFPTPDARPRDSGGKPDAAASGAPVDAAPAPPPPAPMPQPPLPPPMPDPPDAAPEPPPMPPDAAPVPPVPPSGLVGYWKFDEGGGAVASDSSGLGNDGMVGPGVTFVPGGFPAARFPNAGAIDLDGIEGRVVLAINRMPDIDASKTISFWMNYAAVPQAIQAMVSLTNGGSLCGVQIGFRQGQLAVWGWAGGLLVSATPPEPGWHNVVYIFDGVMHTLAVDGITVASSALAPQVCPITDAVVSGYAGGAENFLGTIDDLRIYARALSAAERDALSAGEAP